MIKKRKQPVVKNDTLSYILIKAYYTTTTKTPAYLKDYVKY